MKKNKKEFNEKYKITCFNFLDDYLFFLSNASAYYDSLKKTFNDIMYLQNLRNHLIEIRDNFPYPKETSENISNLLKYLKVNCKEQEQQDLIDECILIQESIKHFCNEYYYCEFVDKINRLKNFNDSKTHIWTKKDIIEGIKFDYITLVSLGAPVTNYVNNYLTKFILNRKYVYSINKILTHLPDVVDNFEFRRRILEVIDANIDLLNNIDDDTLKVYLVNNYDVNPNGQYNVYLTELDQFKEDCIAIKNRLNRRNDYIFNIEEFKNYRDILKLEHYLYIDSKYDVTSIGIDAIYAYIDSINSIEYSHQRRLIDLMNERLKQIKELKNNEERRYYIEQYNDYLVKLNSLYILRDEEYAPLSHRSIDSVDNLIYSRIEVNEYFKMLRENSDIPNNLVKSESHDLEIFDMFLLTDQQFEQVKAYYVKPYTRYCLKNFYNDYKDMFVDETIYNRTKTILEMLGDKNASKVLKKINKAKR